MNENERFRVLKWFEKREYYVIWIVDDEKEILHEIKIKKED